MPGINFLEEPKFLQFWMKMIDHSVKHFWGKARKLKRSQSGSYKRTKRFQMESHRVTIIMIENIANAFFIIQFYLSLRFLLALGRLS